MLFIFRNLFKSLYLLSIMEKRGMSAVITTLIIILLVVVAMGIIWVVVKNVLTKGASQIELAQKCRDVDLTMKNVDVEAKEGDGVWDDYDITLSRTATGENSTGVKFVLSNGTAYSNPIDFGYKLTPLATQTNYSIDNTKVSNATQIEMTPYFDNDKGGEDLCSNTITQEF